MDRRERRPLLLVSAAGEPRYRPRSYLQGGAYVAGSVEASRGVAALLAIALGSPVLAVEYRQGPEHPYPAAVNDTRMAYDWLSHRSDAPFLVAGGRAVRSPSRLRLRRRERVGGRPAA